MSGELDDLDDDLNQLRFDPRRWPLDEWPRPKYTPDHDWIVFAMPLDDQILHAQGTFREFARVAEHDRFRMLPVYDAIAIKAFFHRPGAPMFGEHMFLTDIYADATNVSGILGSDAYYLPDLKEGQQVTIPIAKVSDWFLVHNGRGIGGFTIPHVWESLPPDQQEIVRDQSPFSFFSYRNNAPAEEQLISIPICPICNRRSLEYLFDWDPQVECGMCRNGSRRCDCPRCGAPLIRNEKLPELCARCHENG